MAAINPNDPRPPYAQIADDLRTSIKAGRMEPGERLPSNREMAATYGVAQMTVHQAVRALRNEGVLVSFQGRGVFVASDGQQTSQKPSGSSSDELGQLRTQLDAALARIRNLPDDKSVKELRGEIADLRRQVARLQAQLMDLYSKTGQPYPHEGTTAQREPATERQRRRASGS